MRVLTLPPTRRDGEVTHRLLRAAHVECQLCSDPSEAVREIGRGAGALLLTEKILTVPGFNEILETLGKQEPWSDLPIVMLLQGGALSAGASQMLSSLSNVTLLERPAPIRTVISAVQAALRARVRQYQIREQFQQIRRAEAERQQLLEREQAARREAERTGRIKDEFLATLSHELRTPLSAIFGWVQLLKMSPGDSQGVAAAIEVIDRNVRVQTQLIADLLDMSRIVSGKIRLDVQRVELSEVIRAAIEAVQPAIEAKQLRLEQVVDPQLGSVSGDFGRLQQVLWNLLTNAVKFTPKSGRIHVLAERVNSHVEVSVTDTGEGITAEFLPHLFERFTQADGSITRTHGGLGLGLSIVKNLIEMHGGSITAESPGAGLGATFTVRLPTRIAKVEEESLSHPLGSIAHPMSHAEFDKLPGIKVLVVDDEPDARELMKRFLESSDAIPALAASASEALGLLFSRESPDVIVSDIGMPDEDGYEFMQKVRDRGIKTPAIALTAFARSEDRVRALQAGFQAHLAKPVEPAELLATILRLSESCGSS